MTEPSVPTDPAGTPSTPGGAVAPPERRRLDRAPGERLAAASGGSAGSAAPPGDAGLAHAVGMGAIGAIIGVGVFLVVAIGLAFSVGLLVVAGFSGRLIGLFVRVGGGGQVPIRTRVVASVVIVLVALSVSELATWLWSRIEGGDLGLVGYLDQAYGLPLVGLEFGIGSVVAGWSAR